MASERVAAQEDEIHGEHDRAEADAEGPPSGAVGEPHRLPHVVRQHDQEEEREIQEIAVDVLENQRERVLAEVFLPRLADAAGRRVRPERLVVGAAVVVAGETEAARRPENQERCRKRQRGRPPARLRPEPAMGTLTEEQRGVERREVGPELVVLALECCPGRVDDESAEHGEGQKRLRPPRVAPHRLTEPSAFQGDNHLVHEDEPSRPLGSIKGYRRAQSFAVTILKACG